MAAELGFIFSLTHLQVLSISQQNKHQTQQNPGLASFRASGMSNPNQRQAIPQEDEDSWVVRAFAEDTSNVLGTTWPPRSYTCTFCRRQFRSAQALGGHMNVHRRDRARLHHHHHQLPALVSNKLTSPSSVSSPTLIIPTQEFTSNGGLCVLYQMRNNTADGVCTPTTMKVCPNNFDSSPPVTPFSALSYPQNSLTGPPTDDFQVKMSQELNFPQIYSSNNPTSSSRENSYHVNNNNNNCEVQAMEELDLELRLGLAHRPSAPS